MFKRLLNSLKRLKGSFSSSKHNYQKSLKKQSRKDKILNYLKNHKKVSNSELRRLTGLSSRSIVRYMNELEKEGMVEQIGKIGEAVEYSLKK